MRDVPIVGTYRVQLTPATGFAAVTGHLDRLQALGISHLYLSPVTAAMPGSTHGYDVVDHTKVNDELGGLDGLVALLDALADREMAAIVDHVPNHVAVGRPELNPRWWALLRDGPGSPAAAWFDVEWAAADGRVLLPVLASTLEKVLAGDDVRIVPGDGTTGASAELRVGPQRFPLAAGTESLPVADAIAAQHYRLQHWRDPARNVRRFFTIDDLVAVCVDDRAVAGEVDTVPRLLADHPGYAGARVDHVDGLADPAGYLSCLRDVIGDRWLLVEKILAPGETLPLHWPVDGTTGYEHARVVEHAMLDRAGFAELAERWADVTGDDRPYHEWELHARREALAGGLRPDVERVARAATAAGVDGHVGAAVMELSVHMGRYRTYLPLDAAGAEALRHAYTAAVAGRPELAETLDQLVAAITVGDEELRVRWQQLTGPATAKGVEDRAFFRFMPLTVLCEVGGDPSPQEDDPVAALHAWHGAMQERWPATMLAGTTHDTKRSEDVRARGLSLPAHAHEWSQLVDTWAVEAAANEVGGGEGHVDAATQWLALQTAVTAGPISVERLHAFLVKAAREASVRTSWADPDDDYEMALQELAATVVAWPPHADLAAALDRDGRARSLALLAIRLTAPGVADVYQGTEAFRFVLTDPDNREEPEHDDLAGLVDRAARLDGPG
ncbi:MAG: malto-oligosyltrehalose synthase, partial [Actinomycetota bacterium]|nr:malto-oligosyltrehalose synthase [Actinomycetota bacterium]